MLIDERDRTLTYGEYRAAAERAAAGLRELGVERGTGVSWQLPTWIESLVLMGALARLGAVQNPILPLYREREVGFCTRQVGARWLLVPPPWRGFDYPALARKLAFDLPGLEVLVCDHELPEADPAALPPPPGPDEGDAVRWVYYTSGTTADPKGARHTDRTLMAAGAGLALASKLGPADRYGVAFPFTHVGGAVNLCTLFQAGFALILLEAFDPARAVEIYARHGATLAGGGPAFYLMFLEEQRKRPGRPILPRLRLMTGGGAPMRPEMHFEVKREIGGVGCTHGYGMTECPMISMNSPGDPDEKLAHTSGRPIRGAEVRAVTVEGEVAPPGVEGELRIRGPVVCRGYLDASLDADTFDAEGWLRTGDLGFVDREGYVVLTGRVKDIIIRKGENVSAREVEDLLYTHPKVADVGVIGLPDRERGERVCAVVELADPADPLGFEEMVVFCKGAGLMLQKIPEQLEIVQTLPRNATGKILKHQLRERFGGSSGRKEART